MNTDDDTIDDPAAHPDWTGQCGTSLGYATHKRLHIPQCDPCRAAYSTYRQERRAIRAAA